MLQIFATAGGVGSTLGTVLSALCLLWLDFVINSVSIRIQEKRCKLEECCVGICTICYLDLGTRLGIETIGGKVLEIFLCWSPVCHCPALSAPLKRDFIQPPNAISKSEKQHAIHCLLCMVSESRHNPHTQVTWKHHHTWSSNAWRSSLPSPSHCTEVTKKEICMEVTGTSTLFSCTILSSEQGITSSSSKPCLLARK